MIKRDGKNITNVRNNNVKIGAETLSICKAKTYTAPSGKIVDLSFDLDYSQNETILYEHGAEINVSNLESVNPTLEVINETTTEAIIRLSNAGKTNIAALNFASARSQGGGFLSGAVAQEEDLCRSSGLYPCLKKKPMFYNTNILCDHSYYTDGIIYSPNVPFFRDRNNSLLEEPVKASIIAAPAPNIHPMKQLENDNAGQLDIEQLQALLDNRALRILQVASLHQHKTLILGAWGCGAFGNDPNMVIQAFVNALNVVPVFEYVCFSVYDKSPDALMYKTFKQVFAA